MYGHEPLIRMRYQQIRPSVVFISDFPCAVSRNWHKPGEKFGQDLLPDNPHICTHGDLMSGLDLRFLVDMRVHISADTKGRAKALLDKARAGGAAFGIAIAGDYIEFFQKEAVNG